MVEPFTSILQDIYGVKGRATHSDAGGDAGAPTVFSIRAGGDAGAPTVFSIRAGGDAGAPTVFCIRAGGDADAPTPNPYFIASSSSSE
jgi:hypothetical protein